MNAELQHDVYFTYLLKILYDKSEDIQHRSQILTWKLNRLTSGIFWRRVYLTETLIKI